MNKQRIYNVLFLCTGNSARSVIAEAILNRDGAGHFRAFSAGSQPKGAVHPVTLETLARMGHDVSALRSKSWDEFAGAAAPPMDFIFTVCDNAAGEACPVWPGQPITAHWGFEDPAAFQGSDAEARLKFAEIYGQIERRIGIFVNLPLAALDRMALERRLRTLGHTADHV